ncbi:MAG: DEAD/DEAH box helicase family protein [Bacteroidetes bacterium]|nr:DEAD/DEAH box helicase family protein [Bacteroidota bacterium]
MGDSFLESERVTRKKRIDPKLKHLGWIVTPYFLGMDTSQLNNHAVEEYPTENGPADYALFVDGRLIGILEAKKVTVATINTLEQAKRYAKGLVHSIGTWNGYMVPFLYSSNGEQISFLDVRNTQNLPRPLADFHTPQALKESFNRNFEVALKRLHDTPNDGEFMRPYQKKAVNAIEATIADRKRKMLVAMATGTGKTFMAVNSVYRLLKSGAAKRILFLVDRKSLAAQTAVSFSAYSTPAGNKFNQEYELFSQRFRKEDFEEGDKFDINVLPNEYLTKPDATKTFVYVATIQRMAINLLGKSAVFADENNDSEHEEADKLDIPIHAFDIVIADECHRGYTSQDASVWKEVLEYFDAIKIGLTATPALHTVAYFDQPISRYPIEEAILDGYLVDYNAVKVNSGVRMTGVFLKEGEQVEKINPQTGQLSIENLEDERAYDSSKVEREVTVPDSNKKVIQEIARYALDFERERGRFPKTLIFAVNDVSHVSHADQLVSICKEVFNRGDDFVVKITGNANVDRPLQKIKMFRNRPEPKVVVTVDMLSTGVDIPALEFIVFLRPVKSRILWEQMLGRGTRRCNDINKDSFTVFDCFDGTLIEYFKNVSNFKFEAPGTPAVPIEEIIRRIYNNEDREYNVGVLVKRLRRIEKTMSADARLDFAVYIPDGDIGAFANAVPRLIKNDFGPTMKLLNNKDFQRLLVNYKKPPQTFYVAREQEDTVYSEPVFNVGDRYLKPAEYLVAFSEFVKTHKADIDAMKVVLEKPKGWNTQVLRDLRKLLLQNHFQEPDLRKAHNLVYHKSLVDIISMIKHADKKEPLLSVNERIDKAIEKVFGDKILDSAQQEWISYIKEHLVTNLTLEEDDFNDMPVFENHGGLGRFKRLFKQDYKILIEEINAAIAA